MITNEIELLEFTLDKIDEINPTIYCHIIEKATRTKCDIIIKILDIIYHWGCRLGCKINFSEIEDFMNKKTMNIIPMRLSSNGLSSEVLN